jgi:hypothetical protein
MDTKQGLKVLNSVLAVALMISLASFLDPGFTGSFYGDQEKPSCSFEREGNSSQVPIDRCCMYASQKLSCVERENETICQDSGDQAYVLNPEGADYCREKGFSLE